MAVNISVLHDNELFHPLTEDELALLAPACSEASAPRDTMLFGEGEPATRLYLVTDGQVLLKKRLPAHADAPSRDTDVAVCGRRELVGWSALVAPHRFTLTARVRRPCTYVEVDAPALLEILARSPELHTKLLASLSAVISRRLRQITDSLMAERLLVIAEAKR